jgi:putative flippase GtrA
VLHVWLVKNLRELLAAGLGGAVGTTIDVCALVLLVEQARLSIPLATFLSATAGAGVCFLMNKRIAFRDRSRVTLPQIARFGLVAVAAAFLLALAMKLVAVDLRVPYLAAKALCAATVFLAWTYPAQRRLVFKRPAPVSPAVSAF